ncbi:MAG TPA: permease-like cell division protein FtsX [Jatrophihabitans sp.]|jgi:cell division transport system permease protein
MRANFVLTGVAAGIRRNAAMTIALVLSTAIALTFVGSAILANTEITKFKKTYEDKLNVSVYLCTTTAYNSQLVNNQTAQQQGKPTRPATCAENTKTDATQTQAIRKQLLADPSVKSVAYVSEQEAFQRAKDQNTADVTKFLHVGDLPSSFTVKLNNIGKDYSAFATTFNQVQGIDQVRNQVDTINRLLSIIDSARWFSLIIALVVLFASILLIANTIQTAAAQRKNETSIMRLVGASRWMTELPFMLEAVVAATIGGLIAFALVWVGKHYVLDSVFKVPTQNGVIPNLSINDVVVAGGAGLIVGVVLSAITAFATLRLYVRL